MSHCWLGIAVWAAVTITHGIPSDLGEEDWEIAIRVEWISPVVTGWKWLVMCFRGW